MPVLREVRRVRDGEGHEGSDFLGVGQERWCGPVVFGRLEWGLPQGTPDMFAESKDLTKGAGSASGSGAK